MIFSRTLQNSIIYLTIMFKVINKIRPYFSFDRAVLNTQAFL